jgi:hypothetical protein
MLLQDITELMTIVGTGIEADRSEVEKDDGARGAVDRINRRRKSLGADISHV